MMSFDEIRERLANRDAIRERQAIEEMAEEEKDREEERLKRQQAEKAARQETEQISKPTTAAADTSSEVARKIRDRFMKEVSKVIVKVLDPYRRSDATKGQIKTTEDFKHLAKKVRCILVAIHVPSNLFFLPNAVDKLHSHQRDETLSPNRGFEVF